MKKFFLSILCASSIFYMPCMFSMRLEPSELESETETDNIRSLKDLCCSALFGDDISSIIQELENIDFTEEMSGHVKKIHDLEQDISGDVQILSRIKKQIIHNNPLLRSNYFCKLQDLEGNDQPIDQTEAFGNNQFFSQSSELIVKIWDLNSAQEYECRQSLEQGGITKALLIATNNGDIIYSSDIDTFVEILKKKDDGSYEKFKISSDDLGLVTTFIDLKNDYIACGTITGNIVILKSQQNDNYEWHQVLAGNHGTIMHLVCINHDSFASVAGDKTIKILTLNTQEFYECSQTLPTKEDLNWIISITRLSQDRLAVSFCFGTIEIFNLNEKQEDTCYQTLTTQHGAVDKLILLNQDTFVATGDLGQTLRIWHLNQDQKYELIQKIAAFTQEEIDGYDGITFLTKIDNSSFLSGSFGQTIKIWVLDDAGQYECYQKIDMQTNATILQNGLLVTSSNELDGKITIWFALHRLSVMQIVLAHKLAMHKRTGTGKLALHPNWQEVFDTLPPMLQEPFLGIVVGAEG